MTHLMLVSKLDYSIDYNVISPTTFKSHMLDCTLFWHSIQDNLEIALYLNMHKDRALISIEHVTPESSQIDNPTIDKLIGQTVCLSHPTGYIVGKLEKEMFGYKVTNLYGAYNFMRANINWDSVNNIYVLTIFSYAKGQS